jgi:hypothetical protein
MLHKLSQYSHKIHAPRILMAVFWLSLIFQQLPRSHVTHAIIYPSNVAEFLMVVEHPSQSCEATAAAGESCIQKQLH